MMASSSDSPISASTSQVFIKSLQRLQSSEAGDVDGGSPQQSLSAGVLSVSSSSFITKRLHVQSDGFDDEKTHKVPQTGRELKLTQQQALHEHMYRHRRQACITRGDYRLEEYLQTPKGTLDEKDFVIFDLLWITGLV